VAPNISVLCAWIFSSGDLSGAVSKPFSGSETRDP
jgi:hypothetical protein